MVTQAFERAFHRLVGAFKRYHDVPRNPNNVPELGQARICLDSARYTAATERARISTSVAPTGSFRKMAVSEDEIIRIRIRAISDTARSG